MWGSQEGILWENVRNPAMLTRMIAQSTLLRGQVLRAYRGDLHCMESMLDVSSAQAPPLFESEFESEFRVYPACLCLDTS